MPKPTASVNFGWVAIAVASCTFVTLCYGKWLQSGPLLARYRQCHREAVSTYDRLIDDDVLAASEGVIEVGNRIHLLAQRIDSQETDRQSSQMQETWEHVRFLDRHREVLEFLLERASAANMPESLRSEISAGKTRMEQLRFAWLERVASSDSIYGLSALLENVDRRIRTLHASSESIERALSQLLEFDDRIQELDHHATTKSDQAPPNPYEERQDKDESLSPQNMRRKACRMIGYLCLEMGWANSDAETPHLAKSVDLDSAIAELEQHQSRFDESDLHQYYETVLLLLRSQIAESAETILYSDVRPAAVDSYDATIGLTQTCMSGNPDQAQLQLRAFASINDKATIHVNFVAKAVSRNLCRYVVSRKTQEERETARSLGNSMELAIRLSPGSPETSAILWWLSLLQSDMAENVSQQIRASHELLINLIRSRPSSLEFLVPEMIRAAIDRNDTLLNSTIEGCSMLDIRVYRALGDVSMWRSHLDSSPKSGRLWFDLLSQLLDTVPPDEWRDNGMLAFAVTIWAVKLEDEILAESAFDRACNVIDDLDILSSLRKRVDQMESSAGLEALQP